MTVNDRYYTITEQTIHTSDKSKQEEIDALLKKYKIRHVSGSELHRPKPILFFFIILLIIFTVLSYQDVKTLITAYSIVALLYILAYIRAKYNPIRVKEV